MKKQTRILKNGSDRAAVSQPKIGSTAEPRCQRTRADAGKNCDPYNPKLDLPSCLCIFDRENQAMVSQIPLSEDEFYFMVATCGTNGGSVEQFIAKAVRDRLLARIEAAAGLGIVAESCLKHAARLNKSAARPATLSNAQRRAA